MCSNYVSVELTDIVASLLSAGAIVALLRVWQPGDPLLAERRASGGPRSRARPPPTRGTRRRCDGATTTTPTPSKDVWEAFAPYIIIIAVFSIAQIGPIKTSSRA